MAQKTAEGSPLPSNMQLDTMSTAKQFYEFMNQFNKIAEMCFDHCVHDFTTRRVLDAEGSCAMTCLEKFLKTSNRISLRFQEIHFQQQSNMAPLAAADIKQK